MIELTLFGFSLLLCLAMVGGLALIAVVVTTIVNLRKK